MRRVKKPIIWLMIVAMFFSGGWLNIATPIAHANNGGGNGDWLNGLFSTTTQSSNVIYVKASALPGGDGSSWDVAFDTLQDALYEAKQRASAEQPLEIWVAAGTYTADPDEQKDMEERSFHMLNHVTIYGGFPENSSDGIGMSSRNWDQHRTILSGDIEGNDDEFDENRLKQLVEPDEEKHADNVWHVLYNPNGLELNETAVLDGFIITGGVNRDTDYREGKGAGIYNGELNSPIIRNTIVTENIATNKGAAIFNAENSHLTLDNVVVSRNSLYGNNSDSGYGGGIHNEGNLTIIDSEIKHNFAHKRGGGIHSSKADLTVERSIISHNMTIAAGRGSGAYYGGGGIYHQDGLLRLDEVTLNNNDAGIDSNGETHGGALFIGTSDITGLELTNIVVENNAASRKGAGIYIGKSASHLLNAYTLTSSIISNAIIQHNISHSASESGSGDGGGLYVNADKLLLENATISDNRASSGGGFYYDAPNMSEPPKVILRQVDLLNNEAHRDGGGIYISGSGTDSQQFDLMNMRVQDNTIIGTSSTHRGGGIYLQRGEVVVHNALITGNRVNDTTGDGGGVYNERAELSLNNVTIAHNVVNQNGAGIYAYGNSVKDTYINNSIIWGNHRGDHSNTDYNYYFNASTSGSTFAKTTTTHSILQGAFNGDNWRSQASIDGGGNLDQDPVFREITTVSNTRENDYRLSLGSPAMNAGDDELIDRNIVTTDLHGMERFVDGIDMGPFEYGPDTVPPTWRFTDRLEIVSTEGAGGVDITLSWPEASDNEGTVTYAVYKDDAYINHYPATQFAMTINLDDQPYQFSVIAVDAAGNQSVPLTGTYTPTSYIAPLGWANDDAQLHAIPGQTFITLSWPAAQGQVDGYTLTKNPDGSGSKVYDIDAGTTTETIQDLQPDTSYHFTLVARGPDGTTPALSKSVSTLPIVPGTAGLTIEQQADGAVKLLWDAADPALGISGYVIQHRKLGEEVWIERAVVDANTSSYFESGLSAGTTYEYRIMLTFASAPTQQHTSIAEVHMSDLNLSNLLWRLSEYRIPGMVAVGDEISIMATGDGNRSVSAVVTYASWYDESDQLLDVPVLRESESIPLVEGASGTYEGKFAVPQGASEVTMIEVALSDNGQTVRRSEQLSLEVLGKLEVEVTNSTELPAEPLSLRLWSAERQSGEKININNTGKYTFLLPVANDYVLQLQTLTGVDVAIPQTAVTVEAKASASMAMIDHQGLASISVLIHLDDDPELNPLPPLQLIVRENDEQGNILRDVEVTVGEKLEIFTMEQYLNRAAPEKLFIQISAPWPGQAGYSDVINVQAGAQEKSITLPKRAQFVTLQGRVTDAHNDPVAGADVAVIQEASNYSSQTQTDATGHYELEVLEGAAILNVAGQFNAISRGAKQKNVTINTGEQNQIEDVQLEELRRYTMGIESLTYAIGNNERGIYSFTANEIHQYQFTAIMADFDHPQVMKQLRAERGTYPMEYWLPKGTEVNLCVTPETIGLPEKCVPLTTGEASLLKADFHYDEALLAGTVQGELVQPDGDQWPSSYSLSILNEAGREVYFEQQQGSFLNTQLTEPGRYTFRITGMVEGTPYYAEKVANLQAGSSFDLGNITLQPGGRFAHTPDNTITATSINVTPGSFATVMGVFTNTKPGTIEDTTITISLPGAMTYKQQSLVINGEQVEPVRVTEEQLTFDIGTLAFRNNGQFKFLLDVHDVDKITSQNLHATIDYNEHGQQRQEMFGHIEFAVGGLTIHAAQHIYEIETKQRVHGKAPANSRVQVFADNLLLGETMAAANGFWQLDVQLPKRIAPYWYMLEVVADDQKGVSSSIHAPMLYDSSRPRLELVKMRQGTEEEHVANLAPVALMNLPRFIDAASEWSEFTVTGGIARFPRTMLAGLPFEFELHFNESDRVSNVRVFVDGPAGGRAKAERGTDGIWRAMIETDRLADWRLGTIYVGFDTEERLYPRIAQSITIGESARALTQNPLDFYDAAWEWEHEELPTSETELIEGNVPLGSAVDDSPAPEGRYVERQEINVAGVMDGWLEVTIEPGHESPEGNIWHGNIAVSGRSGSSTGGYNWANVNFRKIGKNKLAGTITGHIPVEDFIAAIDNPSAPQWHDGTLIVRNMESDGSRVTLEWPYAQDDLWIDHYRIYQLDAENNRIGPALVEVWGDTTEATIDGLQHGTTYKLQVAAVNPHGEWSYGPTVQFKAGDLDSAVNGTTYETFAVSKALNAEKEWQQAVRIAAVKKNRVRTTIRFLVKVDDVTGPLSYAMDAWELERSMEALNEILDNFPECAAPMPESLKNAIDKATLATVGDAITPVILGVAGGLAFSGVGLLGGAALVVVGAAASLATGAVKDALFDQVENELANALEDSEDCEEDEEDEEEEEEEEEEAEKERERVPIASPQWKIDPSGIVYEVTEDQVIPGVKATVLFSENKEGPYEVWDGEWWGEQNPQLTDASGWYGWDVPEGWWRVIYEKEGYETTYSQDTYGSIQVPPPHFEVNVPMRSLAAPEVEHVNGAFAGEAIEVTFSRYMKQSMLNENTVLLRYIDGEFISGKVEFVDAVADPHSDSDELVFSKTIRFVPDQSLDIGDEVELTVRNLAESYAGVPLAEDAREQVVVSEKVTLESLQVTPGDVELKQGDVQFLRVTAHYSDGHSADVTADVTWSSSDEMVAYAAGLHRIDGVGVGTTVITATLGNVYATATVKVTAEEEDGDSGADPGSGGGSPGIGFIPVPGETVERAGEVIDEETTSIDAAELGVRIGLPDSWLDFTASDEVRFAVEGIAENELRHVPVYLRPLERAFRTGVTVYRGESDSGTSLTDVQAALTIELDLSHVNVQQADQDKVGLYQYDEQSQTWRYVPGSYDSERQVLTAMTAQLGNFALFISNMSFVDIEDHWARHAIEVLAGREIISGRSADVFDPEADVSRAEFAALLVRLLRLDGGNISSTETFTDVQQSDWYYDEVMIAYSSGLVQGTGANTFAPQASITRQEMAVMLKRALTLLGQQMTLTTEDVQEILQPFNDVADVSDWARAELAWMIDEGLVQGRGQGNLAPIDHATRAEAATLLYRLNVTTFQHE